MASKMVPVPIMQLSAFSLKRVLKGGSIVLRIPWRATNGATPQPVRTGIIWITAPVPPAGSTLPPVKMQKHHLLVWMGMSYCGGVVLNQRSVQQIYNVVFVGNAMLKQVIVKENVLSQPQMQTMDVAIMIVSHMTAPPKPVKTFVPMWGIWKIHKREQAETG